ncbi:nitroreductase family deazaflavin-dependent oxidoreductase [Gordonia sp. OPL2]|uniref:nitroreductase family deazaflavin-dependent oxidoreductase n=1 Tax=Gordonia sp. OPL2 TaxID=2486274 RepID=UPI001654DB7B|nr:nitroreductase family deazaflavin-dependent oxidoreductase [Gordonia sp. OPL2]
MPVMDPNARPAQLGSPTVAALIKVGSRLNAKLYRATGGRLGNSWRVGSGFRKPVPVCLLTTTGRKSGEPRTAPLLYLRKGETFVLVASQGGLPKNPAWYLNLTADPAVSIQVGKDTHDLVARTASDSERAELWPELVSLYADFDTYAAWTDRQIPVVICEPR